MIISRQTIFALSLLGLGLTSQAWATCVANDIASGTAVQTGATWTYTMNVENGCQAGAMTNFYVPYFSDAGIGNITVPAVSYYYNNGVITNTITWTATIEPGNNVFNLAGAGVIDFQVTVSPDLQINGNNIPGVGYTGAQFSFTANYGSVEGPVAVLDYTYTNQGVPTGNVLNVIDPPIPGSPLTIAALNGSAVPEPATTALGAIGLCAALVLSRRRARGRS